MGFWTITDDQLIARVRRARRYRRPIGAVCLVFGLAVAAAILYWVHDLYARSLQILRDADAALAPTTQQMSQVLDESRFNMGFTLGWAMMAGLSGGVMLATTGLIFILQANRKDQLLLDCWDKCAKAS